MKTDTVNTEKWRAEYTHSENGYKKGWHIITGKYDDVIDLPNGSEAQQTGELIVTAVNACKEINPDNPLNVASHLVEFVEMYKKLQMELEHFINATPTGDKRVQLTGLNILALLKLSQVTE